MELVDMRGLKPRPYGVLVQVQVWVRCFYFLIIFLPLAS